MTDFIPSIKMIYSALMQCIYSTNTFFKTCPLLVWYVIYGHGFVGLYCRRVLKIIITSLVYNNLFFM